MHIELFRALKAAKVPDDQAANVCAAMEEFVAMKINEATKSLEAKITAQSWLIGAVGFLLAVIGLAPAFNNLFK